MKLVIAEKPSVANAISPVLHVYDRKDGYSEGNGYLVSWCFGHLAQLCDADGYEQWQGAWSFEQLPMLPDIWKLEVAEKGKKQLYILKSLIQRDDVTEIICATDADREGELIFRYVYMLSRCKKPVQRLWISSLEETAIQEGLRQMKSNREYDPLFQAGYARAKADWLVGMNGSRLFSCRYHDRLSLGRVQTPTLAMIVQRDAEVRNFVKQKYFMVALNLGTFTADSERMDNADQATALAAAVNGKTAAVTTLKKEIKSANPPKLYDLTTLQRDANKWFGYTAKQSLDALQKLYEAKLATYPRTDSQYLSDDMEQTALDMVGKVKSRFPELVTGQEQSVNVTRCINNAKVTGHHAILPTAKIETTDIAALPVDEQNVLLLISARLLLATAEVHKYEAVKAVVSCENTAFTANGKTILENGWKAYEAAFKSSLKSKPDDADQESSEDKRLPELAEGQTFDNVSASVDEHWTTPPKPYTEDTLLSAMEHAGQDAYDEETEKKGLGTPATRAVTIEGLVHHGYIERKKKQITATEKGVNLIKVVPDEVKSPKLTAEWEMQLQQIERGQLDAPTFMNGIISFVKVICEKYGTVDESITFRKPPESLGQCPQCKADVKKGKFGFYCTGKCGMNIAKVYGKELTETQLRNLLSGKQISYTANGRKTIVLPTAEPHEYNGRKGYQWVTKKE